MPFKCPNCTRDFSRRASLRNHIKVHNDTIEKLLWEIVKERKRESLMEIENNQLGDDESGIKIDRQLEDNEDRIEIDSQLGDDESGIEIDRQLGDNEDEIDEDNESRIRIDNLLGDRITIITI